MDLLSALQGLAVQPAVSENVISHASEAVSTEVSREQFEATKAADKAAIGAETISLKGVSAEGRAKPKKVKTQDLQAAPILQGESLEMGQERTPGAKPSKELTPAQQRMYRIIFKRGRS